ncbi:RNA polymerase sigma factor [Streptomyces sp. AM 4-1-1]|uniref:RNA polymerase sigma factor n=1 Tax=Streptomyces sp. AM 4-1-1 TaxID=3028710 RepID=UPI0023B9E890|nr:RNA polymerase sigma factor [Streptomyces sp. AM 4-1-1]WEH37251.1 RNA polymerase sigma factor [Streptomyces sp. AM 4-1-1]
MSGPHESHELAVPGELPERSRKQITYQEFVERHMPEFMRLAMGRLRNLYDADEAVQNAAVNMYAKWTVIEAHANPLALALSMVRAATIDYYRRRARLAGREIPLPNSGLPRTPSADDLLELRGYDRLDQARAALEERAPKQAECVRLRYLEEKNSAEIAEYLNISPGAAKANIYLGLKALHALMDLPEPGKRGDS